MSQSNLTLEFIGRSMDYVNRQLELLEWSRNVITTEKDKVPLEFVHVERSIDYLARFMEGSVTFEIFTMQEINRFVADTLAANAWRFIQGLQQYVFVAFSPTEIVEIAKSLAFSIAPNKLLDEKGVVQRAGTNDYAQSPAGTDVYDNTPDEILDYLFANMWLMPLVSLGMSRTIPTLNDEEEPRKHE